MFISRPSFLETDFFWLVVSNHLKNISQIGNLPQIGVKIQEYFKPPSSFALGGLHNSPTLMEVDSTFTWQFLEQSEKSALQGDQR